MMRMRSSAAAIAMLAATTGATDAAHAASTPQILTGKGNSVPACVTPQRLMAFIGEHNKALPPKLRDIAADYKKHGDELHVRWDYAFYQMVVETNYLKFLAPGGRRGDVSPGQNNFAGLGATGHRNPGESFPDVDTGVLAHLQHIRLYSGDPVESPVAERTKLVTDLILPWAQSLKHPVTFTDLTHKWAPGGHSYSDAIEGVADLFRQSQCNGAAATEQTADASADATDEPAPVAKMTAKPAAKIAAVVVKKQAQPAPAAPAATDETVADASGEAAPSGTDLAGPALKKPAKIATAAPAAKAMPAPQDDANATEGAATTVAEAAPAKPAANDDTFSGETVSAAAGKVVKTAMVDGSKLPVAATVVAPAADATADGTDVAQGGDSGGDGDGGAVEVAPPAAKAPAGRKAVAAVIAPKAIISASAGDLPVVPAKAKIKTAKSAPVETADGASVTTETTTEDAASNTQLASLTVPARIEPAKNCKVFTASYGGGKSLLIQSIEGDHTRFTALTVNEAKADNQAKAFINVYAKGGQKIGEFGTQNEALTKAFQLCPES